MKRLLIAAVLGVFAVAMAMPATAQAHWRHTPRIRHHGWSRGPSYFPLYAAHAYTYAQDPYAPVCTWHRDWGGYWHRVCF